MVKRDEVEIAQVDPELAEARVLPLLSATMIRGHERFSDNKYWQWKHVKNPVGKSIVFAGTNHAGEVVSVRAFMPWRLMINGESSLAYRPVDSATHSDFQRLGLFSRATEESIKVARIANAALSLGNPTANSLVGYEKLGWSVLAQTYTYFSPLTFGGSIKALNRAAAGVITSAAKFRSPKTTEESPSQPATNARANDLYGALKYLGESNNADAFIHTDYSENFVKWRYVDDPRFRHGIHVERSGGTPKWAVAYRIRRSRRGQRVMVVGQFATQVEPNIPTAAVVDSMKQLENCESIHILSPDMDGSHPLEQAGFRRFPNHSYTVTYRALANESSEHSLVRNWRLELSDFLGI